MIYYTSWPTTQKKGGAYFGYGIYNLQSQQEFDEIYELWLKVAKARYISTNDIK